jgi:hypothetical protein
MQGTFDLRPIIADAVRSYGGQSAGVFSSGSFAVAVRREFDLAEIPDDEWAAKVLSGLAYVTRFKGHDVWRLIDPANRAGVVKC